MNLFVITCQFFGHAFAFGLVIDMTTITNFVMIVVVLFGVKWLSRSTDIAVWVTSSSWLLLELEAAYRFEWEGCCPGNLGDVGELAMAVGLSLLFRRFFRRPAPGEPRPPITSGSCR
jgi:hypothetical protein